MTSGVDISLFPRSLLEVDDQIRVALAGRLDVSKGVVRKGRTAPMLDTTGCSNIRHAILTVTVTELG